jgi:hypothetical protein
VRWTATALCSRRPRVSSSQEGVADVERWGRDCRPTLGAMASLFTTVLDEVAGREHPDAPAALPARTDQLLMPHQVLAECCRFHAGRSVVRATRRRQRITHERPFPLGRRSSSVKCVAPIHVTTRSSHALVGRCAGTPASPSYDARSDKFAESSTPPRRPPRGGAHDNARSTGERSESGPSPPASSVAGLDRRRLAVC